MVWCSIPLCLALILPAADAVVSSPSPEVVRAIESYQPFWSPAVGELRGWVIGIDPAGGGRRTPGAGVGEDLNLLTAGLLYQHVRAAGGTSVLTRTDDPLLGPFDEKDSPQRARLLRDAKAHLGVSIDYRPQTGPAVVGVPRAVDDAVNEARTALAGSLAAAFGGIGVQTARPDGQGSLGDALPVVTVRLAAPLGKETAGGAERVQCRADARRLYVGIAEYCRSRGAADRPQPTTAATKARSRAQRRAVMVWPNGHLPDSKLGWFCRAYARLHTTNRSMVYLRVDASAEEGTVVLRGATNAPSVVPGLIESLAAVGRDSVRSEMRTLPDKGRLGEEMYGVCKVPMALILKKPEARGGALTQLLLGEPVFLLDREKGWFLLHAGDGYWGWVREEAIQRLTAARFVAYLGRDHGVVKEDVVRATCTIPRGARLPVVDRDEGVISVRVPDGSLVELPAEFVFVDEATRSRAAANRVSAGLELLNIPYVWGGRSPLGLDCSGLVTNIWAQAGEVAPARDAWQQAFAGRLVATRWLREGMRAGDHVFFIDSSGKIYHTGVAITPTHVVHASPPGVRIGSLKRGDRLYDARLDHDFFMAKRP
ncbi:MAG: hypothetical protein GY842_15985 [bacterium]|nr:hypothetical protein [bacterium]